MRGVIFFKGNVYIGSMHDDQTEVPSSPAPIKLTQQRDSDPSWITTKTLTPTM